MTLKEKQREMKENLDRVLRISSVFHNIQRNKETRRKSKLLIRSFNKELKLSKDIDENKMSRMLIRDCMERINKMETFIKEDLSYINKELKNLRFIGIKKTKGGI